VVTSSARFQVRGCRLSTKRSSSAQTDRKLEVMKWRRSGSELDTARDRGEFTHAIA